jgi:hypothetical protein
MCRAKVEGLMVIGACHPRPELAGYVLAYLWGDDWARARECPGITGILQRGNKMATMPDACVKLLRIAEAQTDEGLKRYLQGIDADAKRSGRRRRRRKSRRIGGTA